MSNNSSSITELLDYSFARSILAIIWTVVELIGNPNCIACPIMTEWSIEAQDAQNNADSLDSALKIKGIFSDELFSLFLIYAKEEMFSVGEIEEMNMLKENPIELHEQVLGLIATSQNTATEIRKEINESCKDCPGLGETETEIDGNRYIFRFCRSPFLGDHVGSIEPVHVTRKQMTED